MAIPMDARGPFLVIPTKRGGVPSLTPTQVNAILDPSERFLAVSVFDAADFVKPCLTAKVPINSFCGFPGYRVVMTLRSSFQGLHASANATDAAVAGDSDKGRVVVSVENWRSIIKATQPKMAVGLHDFLPLSEPASKRRRVAATRSETWLSKTVEMGDLGCTVLPPISATPPPHKSGFIDVVPRNENVLEYLQTLQSLNLSGRDCSMCVAADIPALMAAMISNVSLIECPLPWVLAEKGVAIVLPIDPSAAGSPPLLDLNDNSFTLDINPIAEGCPCFTCTRHCRAYLHHLLTVQEMNSDILLAIHNLAQVVGLIRAYRLGDAATREALSFRILKTL